MFKIEVSGIDKITKDLDKFSANAVKKIIVSINTGAEIIKRDAQTNAPVDTGEGKASIHVVSGLTRYKKPYASIVAAGGKAYYMIFQEFGTAKIKATAFMRKAADKNRDKVVGLVKAAIKAVKWQ